LSEPGLTRFLDVQDCVFKNNDILAIGLFFPVIWTGVISYNKKAKKSQKKPITKLIYQFKDHIPVIHGSAYIHPLAAVTGDVVIGKNVYVGPGAAIRGDWGRIVIEDGCNVQENCTIHMFPGITITLQESAHIGHGAIIHGAQIGKNALVGMNAVIMDNAIIGDESIVGALSFVKADDVFKKRSLIVG